VSAPITTSTEHDGRLERIVLDRPKANVLDLEMGSAIRGHLAAIRGRAELSLVVFEGAGKHFSFGASIEEHLPDRIRPVLEGFHALFRDIEALGVPTAAVVRGQCLGGGFELATWCGMVFASPDAKLGVPESKLAVFPPVAAIALPFRIGGAKTTRLVLSGESLDAATAHAWGVVDEIADDPGAEMEAWFHAQLVPKSAVAIRHAWRAVRAPMVRALEVDLPFVERLYLDELMSHADPTEGIRAFLDKREPEWKHR